MRKKNGRRDAALSAVAIAVVIIVVVALLAIPFLFLQYRTVDVREEQTIPMSAGIERINLTVTATVGLLKVEFVDLAESAVQIVAEVKGHAGFFGEESPLRLSVAAENDTARGGNEINASVNFDTYAPWPYYSVSERYFTVLVDESLRADLNLSVKTGGVVLTTTSGVVLDGLRLAATNDGAVISLNNGTVLAGDLNIKTATGGTMLRWNNVTVRGDHTISLGESSGPIDAQFDQVHPLGSNVTLISKDTVGETRVAFVLAGEVSAQVVANGGIGGVELVPLGGFTGTAKSFLSVNHPAPGSFNARLNNSIGGIIVEGSWSAT
jgi:hypothetical protein